MEKEENKQSEKRNMHIISGNEPSQFKQLKCFA